MSHRAIGGEIGAIGPSKIDYVAGVDFQVVSGDAQAVQTMTLTGSPVSVSPGPVPVPALSAWGMKSVR